MPVRESGRRLFVSGGRSPNGRSTDGSWGTAPYEDVMKKEEIWNVLFVITRDEMTTS